MFEFSVACKYLLPRWRQLSVSIISMISVLVIALVVWLIVVFFSITNGLEKMWVQKLIALTAPVRITPTPAYYQSYYYQVDNISAAAGYSSKTIGEKLASPITDPYDPMNDEEIPASWPLPQYNAEGQPKDLVKEVFNAVNSLHGFKGLAAQDFEMTFANLRLRLARHEGNSNQALRSEGEGYLTQAAYLVSLDEKSHHLKKTLLPLSMADVSNVMRLTSLSAVNSQEDFPENHPRLAPKETRDRLDKFFKNVRITQLKTDMSGWLLPKNLFPSFGSLQALAIVDQGILMRLYIPQHASTLALWKKQLEDEGFTTQLTTVTFSQHELQASLADNQLSMTKSKWSVPIFIEGNLLIPAQMAANSLLHASQTSDLLFDIKLELQGLSLAGTIPYGNLSIGEASINDSYVAKSEDTPQWVHAITDNNKSIQRLVLPSDTSSGDGILLPKTFKEAGALVGDRGYLSYYTPTASAVQEQRIPIYVAGFYDPGIIPVGGKLVLVNKNLTSLIQSTYNQDHNELGNGINVWFDSLSQADAVKTALQQAFKERGIDKYWHVETYREYEFTRDMIQQLQSEKNIWSLIATVIIIVACSNIISMLIILVNDKKVEIGILMSMGATQRSIAAIFGLCGVVMGLLGSLIGTFVAVLTLHHLDALLDLISSLQGYAAFNAHFYGDIVPNELSVEALSFVFIATALISLLAGVVPATKASLLRPSAILRKGEG